MKKVHILFYLASLFLFSCTSTSNIYTNITADGGQLIFLRPMEVVSKNKEITKFSADITVHVKDGSITQNPIVNYTITRKITSPFDVDSFNLGFYSDNYSFFTTEKKLLYKNVVKEHFIETRFTSEIDKDLFLTHLLNENPHGFVLSTNNFDDEVVFSEELDNRLSKLKVML